MENKKENALVAMNARREQNAKSQLKSVVLESISIFGFEFTKSVIDECFNIYDDYLVIISSSDE